LHVAALAGVFRNTLRAATTANEVGGLFELVVAKLDSSARHGECGKRFDCSPGLLVLAGADRFPFIQDRYRVAAAV